MFHAGQLLGHYRIIKPLGQGGMGTVYQAVHEVIGRQAAIKEIHPEIADSPNWVQRFLNEARAVNLIAHPNIVQIYETGTSPEGRPFLVMELLEGHALDERRQQAGGRLFTQAPTIGRQIALALQAAHEKGIVHRDLKPANVMLVPDARNPGHEQIKVLDFGIAKLEDGTALTPAESPVPRTRTGVRMGTPAYMAPEQCVESGQVDAKADVYALGVTLYELLSGQRPFSAELAVELMTLHVRQQPRPLKTVAADVPDGLAALIHSMLRKRPAERPTMGEVAERLAAFEGKMMAAPSQDSGRAALRTPVNTSTGDAELAELRHASMRQHSAPKLAAGTSGSPALPTAWRWLGVVLLLVATLSIVLAVGAWWRVASHPFAPLPAAVPSPSVPQPATVSPPTPPSLPPVLAPARSPAAAVATPTPAPKAANSATVLPAKRPAGEATRARTPDSPSTKPLFEDLTPIDP